MLAYASAYPGTFTEEADMNTERHVRLFRNGRNQAVRIPRDLELPGKDAILRKEGDCLILEPIHHDSLLTLLATWEPMEEEFPEIEDLPPEPVDL
jgi:antitoxin VapB